MQRIWIWTCIAMILLVSHAASADPVLKPEATEIKAEVLEQSAVTDGCKEVPSPSETIKKIEVQLVDPSGLEPMDDAITCLARTIYWEARGEDAASMEAIADVVMNRLCHEGFPATICEVVMEGREKSPCQFSWWCDGRSDDAKEDDAYIVAKEIARKALNRQLPDHTNGALYFHRRDVNPDWTAEYIKTVEIGVHLFYKPPGGVAK